MSSCVECIIRDLSSSFSLLQGLANIFCKKARECVFWDLGARWFLLPLFISEVNAARDNIYINLGVWLYSHGVLFTKINSSPDLAHRPWSADLAMLRYCPEAFWTKKYLIQIPLFMGFGWGGGKCCFPPFHYFGAYSVHTGINIITDSNVHTSYTIRRSARWLRE